MQNDELGGLTLSPEVDVPESSQFFSKAEKHENTHVTQWSSESPWKDLYNADQLYDNVLSYITSKTSEQDVKNQIFHAIYIYIYKIKLTMR